MICVLDEIKEKLSDIGDLESVLIGEWDGDIPLSVRNFAIIEEANPSETFEYRGTFARHSFFVNIKVASVTPAPLVEKSVKETIRLSSLVKSKICADPTLNDTVKNLRLLRITPSISKIGGGRGEERFARCRILSFELWRYETAL
jgi:hypothetical protein